MTVSLALDTARWTLGPLLLAQGRRVRRTTPELPEAAGDREGVAGSGPLLRLMVLGDSAAAGVGAAHQDEGLLGRVVAGLAPRFRVEYRLVARTGATTASTVRHLAKASATPVDVVLTSLGVNDVTRGIGIGDFIEQQGRLFEVLRAKFGARRVIVSSLPPVHRFPALPQPLRWYLGARAKELDAALARALPDGLGAEYLAVHRDLVGAQMASDGFHPGPSAYAAWGAAAAGRIAAIEPM